MDLKPFPWEKEVAKLSPEQVAELSANRGYRPEFVQWFSDQGLIGWSSFRGGRWCFPVHEGGHIVAAHQIPPTKGEPVSYFPKGRGVHPLIVGDLATASRIYVFESQWDMMAALDAANYHREPRGAYVATRGAANRLPETLPIPSGKTLFAIMQNDPVKNGKVPAEDWLRGLREKSEWPVHRVDTPAEYEDPQAWLAGTGLEAFREGLREAVKRALCETESEKGGGTDGIADHSGIPHTPPVRSEPEDEPASPCPIEALDGLVAGSMAREVARVAAVPDALAAAAVLGVASGAIGAGLRVSTYAGETGANLWFLAVARSGTGKDRCLNLAAEPLLELERDRLEAWEADIVPDLEADLRIVKAELSDLDKAIKSDPGPQTKQAIKEAERRRAEIEEALVAEPCITIADVTKEALAVTLSRQPGEAVFAVSAEARGILDIVAGRYSKCGDEDLWTAVFSGGAVKVNRIGRKPVALRSPRLAALLMIQPDAFKRAVARPEMAESGFLPRFVLFDAKASPKYAQEQIERLDADVAEAWRARIEELVVSFRDIGEGTVVALDARAGRLLRNYANNLVDRRNADLRDLDTFAARWAEIACRLSLVLHAVQHGAEAASVPISEETALRAVRIVQWFSGETADLLGDLRESRRRERSERLRVLLAGAENGAKTLRDLERRHGFERAEIEAILPQIGGRIETEAGKRGRPSTVAKLTKPAKP